MLTREDRIKGGKAGKGKSRQGKILRSASTEGSNAVLKPWEKDNISRATWYRRRASNKINTIDGRFL